MKRVFLAAMAAALMSCGGNNTEQNQEPAETALPPSKSINQDVMVATGENVVFFMPSEERLEELKKSNPNIEADLESFKMFMKASQSFLKAKNINFFESMENSIKLKVSESQFYLINAEGVKEGYGVSLAKLNAKPLTLQGIKDEKLFEEEARKYYGM
jgi:hypothetical protein